MGSHEEEVYLQMKDVLFLDDAVTGEGKRPPDMTLVLRESEQADTTLVRKTAG